MCIGVLYMSPLCLVPKTVVNKQIHSHIFFPSIPVSSVQYRKWWIPIAVIILLTSVKSNHRVVLTEDERRDAAPVVVRLLTTLMPGGVIPKETIRATSDSGILGAVCGIAPSTVSGVAAPTAILRDDDDSERNTYSVKRGSRGKHQWRR
jgi:hypothetical protein